MSSQGTGKHVLHYVVGNTYYKQRNGSKPRQNYWVLFLDVVSGDSDLLQRVTFKLDGSTSSTIFCDNPLPTTLQDGTNVMRFSTGIQMSSGHVKANIKLLGRGKTVRHERYDIVLKSTGKRSKTRIFRETRRIGPRLFLPMQEIKFGVELELSCANKTPIQNIANHIRRNANLKNYVKVEMDYNQVHEFFDGWKLVSDGSIECSRHSPDCSRFELVSPILVGGEGLKECHRVLKALSTSASITVNKSMGFHVHINVEGFSLQDRIKVCQNFITFEDTIDTFMPRSRRTGSKESDVFCKSNKIAVLGGDVSTVSNTQYLKKLSSCKTIDSLYRMMQPKGRYYKLNMQNLATGRQPTIEFRQHSATSNYEKIGAWVRFCTALVYNSRNSNPRQLPQRNKEFDMLFNDIIKDRALRDVYAKRRDQLGTSSSGDGEDDCCASCAHGGKCSGNLSRDIFVP